MVTVTAYAVLRTGVAVVLGGLALGRGLPVVVGLGQLAADLAAAALILAFGSHAVREPLGAWAILLTAFLIGWEGVAAARRWRETEEGPEPRPWAEVIAAPWLWLWELAGVAPVVGVGLLVAAEQVLPGQFPLPDRPPPFACTPAALRPGDTLSLRMQTPHGGELRVITPDGTSLVVVPFAPAAALRAQRFEHLARLHLVVGTSSGQRDGGGPTVPVFEAAGRYVIVVGALPGAAWELTCEVTFSAEK